MSAPSYAGIGSRRTPQAVLSLMRRIATVMLDHYVLRTGCADGADAAFERGARDAGATVDLGLELYLPWPGFNRCTCATLIRPSAEAKRIAELTHTAYHKLSSGAQNLHARNSHQILGKDLDSPVDFVICYTTDGAIHETETTELTGGTGQAIRLASRRGIKVWNLKRDDHFKAWTEYTR